MLSCGALPAFISSIMLFAVQGGETSAWDVKKVLKKASVLKENAIIDEMQAEQTKRCREGTSRKIFFTHTSNQTDPTALMWCSIESASRLHPSIPICVLSNNLRKDLAQRMKRTNVIIMPFTYDPMASYYAHNFAVVGGM
jgi:hypothetical protein